MTFHTIAIAATFDHLHKGHEKFLTKTFQFGKKVIIGLTSDAFQSSKSKIQNPKLHFKTENFKTRKENLEKYLKENHLLSRAEIIEIQDIYGPAIDPKSKIEALVVTRDTLTGARKVNKKRKELHLSPLKIITVPFELAQDRKRISSTRIRNGLINREGKIYKRLLTFNPTSRGPISETLRQKLKEPQGKLIKGDPSDLMIVGKKLRNVILAIRQLAECPESVLKTDSGVTPPMAWFSRMTNGASLIISIGDEVTRVCNDLKIPLFISMVDFKVNRRVRYSRIEQHGFSSDFNKKGNIITVKNPPGYIRKSLVDAIYRSIHRYLTHGERTIIKVLGEEDLAGLPAMLLAPLNSIVLYGQPGRGIVVTEVTEELKERLLKMIA